MFACLTYLFVGALISGLAALDQLAVMRQKSILSAGLSFLLCLLGVCSILNLESKPWYDIVSYALGMGLGSFFVVKYSK